MSPFSASRWHYGFNIFVVKADTDLVVGTDALPVLSRKSVVATAVIGWEGGVACM